MNLTKDEQIKLLRDALGSCSVEINSCNDEYRFWFNVKLVKQALSATQRDLRGGDAL